MLMVETIFDTLNAKAAAFAIKSVFDNRNMKVPVLISGTIVDKSGRTLSGQTVEAFFTSMKHINPFCIGLNCALGAEEMLPFISRLSKIASEHGIRVLAYPNAGLPNEMGEYDQPPVEFAKEVSVFLENNLIDLVGGWWLLWYNP